MFGLTIAGVIARILTLVIAFTIHELAHAYTAVQLGDETPRRMGRLTLNPLAHLDPLGSLLLVFAGFGWAKPVQVNPYNLRPGPQLGMGIVAAAGPFSNFVMAALAAIPFRFGFNPDIGIGSIFTLGDFLQEFIYINLLLMLFNLIPLPPLDGSKILRAVAPRQWDSILNPLEQYGPLLLMALVFLGGRFLGVLVGQPALAIFRALVG